MSDIRILAKPSSVTWDEVSNVLVEAHKANASKGFIQNTVNISGEELKEKVGLGRCFVAMDGTKVVGTLSVTPKDKIAWFCKGNVLYYMLLGILPSYQGNGIYSKLIAAREDYARKHHFNVLYMYTAEANHKMQQLAEREGFRLVAYSVSPKTDYYSVELAKWLDGSPFSELYCRLRFLLSKYYIKLRYKPGAIKRFCI